MVVGDVELLKTLISFASVISFLLPWTTTEFVSFVDKFSISPCGLVAKGFPTTLIEAAVFYN